ncbi:MAG TPA: SET domain-containing protein-lysine N-methyltransferase [Patescibacteria group bacterium]|nr:SET domain-containing protein-lysine N-methyltransferase [Patescibacteria group bacterium]
MLKIQPTVMTRKDGLYLAPVHGKGRGLFCTDDIAAGEVIEISPVFIFNEQDSPVVATTVIGDYYFSGENLPESVLRREGITDAAKSTCFAMGAVSYCNHLVDANAKAEKKAEHDTVYYVLTALKDIPNGTEICINYGLSWMTFRRHRSPKHD